MKNNRSTEDLKQQYEELSFRMAVNEIMSEEGDKLIKENEKLKTDPQFALSEETLEEFKKEIKILQKKELRKRSHKKMWKVALSTLCVVIVLFMTLTFSVSAFRERIIEFFSSITQKYTSYEITDSNKNQEILASYGGKYIPNWIPDGYVGEQFLNFDTYNILEFNKNNFNISIYEGSIDTVGYENTEDFITEKNITLKSGIIAQYYANDKYYVLFWKDEENSLSITVSSNDPEVDLEKFANNLYLK